MGKEKKDGVLQRGRRIPYQVKVVMHPEETRERVEGEVRDLSMGGMFVKTLMPREPGTVFKIEVPMQPLNYIGRVRVLWTRLHEDGPGKPYGMAVEWVDLTVNQKRLLYLQIDDHVRGGGKLLAGDPEAIRNDPPAKRMAETSKEAVSQPNWLIIGLSIAVVVLLIAVVLIL